MNPPLIHRPPPPPPPLRSKGRVLAVKLMPENEPFEWDSSGPQGNYASVKWYGLCPVLLVERVIPKTQSTIFYGQRLYMLDNDCSIFDFITGWEHYMDQFLNKSKTWSELTQIPIWPGLRRIYTQPQLPQDPPVAEAPLTLLGAGYNPLKGYWVEFQGNFFLGFPLFQPASGANNQIAYGGGNASQQENVTQSLTANGFDVPQGDGSKKC